MESLVQLFFVDFLFFPLSISTLTQNDDEQRVWAICREFWGNNEAPLDIENYDANDLSMAYAKRRPDELESLLDKLGWEKE